MQKPQTLQKITTLGDIARCMQLAVYNSGLLDYVWFNMLDQAHDIKDVVYHLNSAMSYERAMAFIFPMPVILFILLLL